MSDLYNREDIRIAKTEKALLNAVLSLLGRQTFNQISVKTICHEAQISRATFYTHFQDKYSLLRYCLDRLEIGIIRSGKTYDEVAPVISSFFEKNQTVLKNLLEEAESETLYVLYDYIISLLNVPPEEGRSMYLKHSLYSNFFAGGIVRYLYWQVKNKFPVDLPPLNTYLFEIIEKFREWLTE